MDAISQIARGQHTKSYLRVNFPFLPRVALMTAPGLALAASAPVRFGMLPKVLIFFARCSVTAIVRSDSAIRDKAMRRIRPPLLTNEPLAPRGVSFIPLRVIATIGGTVMETNSTPSVDAEEICKELEQAVLKYFPRPVENVDTFLFASVDDTAAGDLQSEKRR